MPDSSRASPWINEKTHRDILRLQGLNALSNIAIIDVAAVNLHEVAESDRTVSRGFVGRAEFIVQRHAGVLIDIRKLKRLFIPTDGCFRNTLIKKALSEPGIGLHDLREGIAALHRLADLLQLADRFFQQAHFAESYAEVVVSFR